MFFIKTMSHFRHKTKAHNCHSFRNIAILQKQNLPCLWSERPFCRARVYAWQLDFVDAGEELRKDPGEDAEEAELLRETVFINLKRLAGSLYLPTMSSCSPTTA